MRFGIAIPVAGQAQFIGEALRSQKAQSVDYQLAVMDATPDESVQEVVRRYSDVVFYNRHGPDAGQAAAIREGWDRMDAELLGWLCADDYYFPYTFQEARRIFETRKDIDVVYGDTVFTDEKGRFLRYFPYISEDISRITKSCCISQPSCFVRRPAIERVGGLATDLHFVMDWDLWTRLYLSGAKFYYLQKPLAVSRMYEGTKTASRSRQRYQEISTHLKTYTGRISRIRSLMGFYFQDLVTKRVSWLDWSVYSAMRCIQTVKLWGAGCIGRRRFLYGFELSTNTVEGLGEIWLPWFEDTAQCVATIVVDREIKLRATLPSGRDTMILCEPVGKAYQGSVLIDSVENHVVHLRIRSADADLKWRLKSVALSSVEPI